MKVWMDPAANDPDPRFDLITLWTVIEHLRNPWSELARLHRFLRPGGWLLMSTMDIRRLRARAEGRKWGNYEIPRMTSFISTGNLCSARFARPGFRSSLSGASGFGTHITAC